MADGKKKGESASVQQMTTRGLRMTADYALWLDRFAESERMGVATLIDRAVAAYAKQAGFEAPPQRTK